MLLLGSYYPKPAGVEVYCSELTKNMRKMGVQVEVATYSYGKSFSGEIVDALPTSRLPFIRGIAFTFLGFLRVLSRGRRFDVVNAHYALTAGIAASIAKNIQNVRLITTCHGTDVLLAMQNPLAKACLHLIAKQSDRVITVSRYLQKKLQELGIPPSNVEVVYGGVDRSLFTPSISREFAREKLRLSQRSLYMLFIGGSDSKGLSYLLEAFAMLSREHGNLRLLIVGVPQIKRSAIDPRIRDRIVLLGRQPYEEMPYVFRSSDLYVSPSTFEGFGLTVLESMASGIPVVAAKVGGIPEVTGKSGAMLVPARDASAIASACNELLQNRAFYEDLAERGIERSKIFTWKRTAWKTINLMEKMRHE